MIAQGNNLTSLRTWVLFKEKKDEVYDSSFLKVNIFWFLSSSMAVNWLSLGCGQNKTFEDVVLCFGKHYLTFLNIFWHSIDKTTNCLTDKIINRLISILIINSASYYYNTLWFCLCCISWENSWEQLHVRQASDSMFAIVLLIGRAKKPLNWLLNWF